MALLTAVATDPHRLDDLAEEFQFPRGSVALSLSTIQKTVIFLPKCVVALSCGDVLGNYKEYACVPKSGVNDVVIKELPDGFSVSVDVGTIQVRLRTTDRTAVTRLRTWLGNGE